MYLLAISTTNPYGAQLFLNLFLEGGEKGII